LFSKIKQEDKVPLKEATATKTKQSSKKKGPSSKKGPSKKQELVRTFSGDPANALKDLPRMSSIK